MKRRYYIPKEFEAGFVPDDSMDILERFIRAQPDAILKIGLVSNVDGDNLSFWPWATEFWNSVMYRGWGPRGCLDKFCDSVADGSPIAPEVLRGVAESLDLIRTEVDAVPPETKSRSKEIGRIAATHLGLLGEKGRSSDTRSREKALMAAAYFFLCQNIDDLSYDDASEKTAVQFNVTKRRAQQYNQEYGTYASLSLQLNAIKLALDKVYDELFVLTRKIKKGELVAKSEESTIIDLVIYKSGVDMCISVRRPTKEPILITPTFRPPTKEQILTIPRWKNPRDRVALVNWWFNNTVYANPEDKEPISESIKISDGTDGQKFYFIFHLVSVVYSD